MVDELDRGDFRFKPKKLELYMKHRESPPPKQSIGDTLQVVIASELNVHQVESLVEVLIRFKRALGRLLGILLGSLTISFHIKSNSYPIICQVLSTREV